MLHAEGGEQGARPEFGLAQRNPVRVDRREPYVFYYRQMLEEMMELEYQKITCPEYLKDFIVPIWPGAVKWAAADLV